MARKRRKFGEIEQRGGNTPGKPPRYRARYTGPDGAKYSAPSTFATQGDAEKFLQATARAIERDTWNREDALEKKVKTPTQGIPLFADYAETYIQNAQRRPKRPIRPSTADNYRQLVRGELSPVFGRKRLNRIGEQDVTRWYESRANEAPTAAANAYVLLRQVMRQARTEGFASSDPCVIQLGRKQAKREGQSLTPEELHRYLAAVPDAEVRVALILAGVLGLRSGEIRGLRVKDVDISTGRVSVRQGVYRVNGEYVIQPPKTAAGRRDVWAMGSAGTVLAWYKLDLPEDVDPNRLLFVQSDGVSPWHESKLRKAHEKGRAAINKPDLRVHDLRRTAAVLFAQGGATIKELQALLGHTTPEMAMVYQTAAAERMRAGMERVDALLGESLYELDLTPIS